RIFIDPKVILSSYNIILFCLNMINLFFATHFVN
ncbi:cytochrome C assembly protein, partial [Staphylococcus aureus]|nr:cytochrome C assembly protein [Staphylococcus aureus]